MAEAGSWKLQTRDCSGPSGKSKASDQILNVF